MAAGKLHIHTKPSLKSPSLIIGFTGWMNGGEVSMGTVKYLIDKFNAEEFAHIDPEGFFIYNFPGSMEVSALFRPHVHIQEGLTKKYLPPNNLFYCDRNRNLIFFLGKEPHLAWQEYEDCVFSICNQFKVESIYFIGSVAGITPHTREPRITYSTSDEGLKEHLMKLGMKPVSYKGPAHIVSSFMVRAVREALKMVTLVAEIPAYVDGYNPRCVETTIKLVAQLTGVQIEIDDLRKASALFEEKLNELLETQPQLAEKVKKLEEDYDSEAFDRELSDLSDWMGGRGLKVD